MTDKDALNILQETKNSNGLKYANASFIKDVFNALVFFDSSLIEEQAKQFLQQLDLMTLKVNSTDTADFQHCVIMEVFNASMLDFLQKKSSSIESSVEDDIPLWIEAHAETIARTKLKEMEKYIITSGKPSDNDLIEFHQKVDFSVYESQQNIILQKTWEAIELKISNYLKNFI